MSLRNLFAIAALSIACAGTTAAQDKPGSPSLQEQAQNPIASLISVPIQNNWNFGVGEFDKTQYVMNVQPVYPAALSSDWNLIIRPIVPFIYKPKLFTGDDSEFGLGDITPQIFFSPSKPVDTLLIFTQK